MRLKWDVTSSALIVVPATLPTLIIAVAINLERIGQVAARRGQLGLVANSTDGT
jgi:hypothetical protein